MLILFYFSFINYSANLLHFPLIFYIIFLFVRLNILLSGYFYYFQYFFYFINIISGFVFVLYNIVDRSILIYFYFRCYL